MKRGSKQKLGLVVVARFVDRPKLIKQTQAKSAPIESYIAGKITN